MRPRLDIRQHHDQERGDGADEKRKQPPEQAASPFGLGQSGIDEGQGSPADEELACSGIVLLLLVIRQGGGNIGRSQAQAQPSVAPRSRTGPPITTDSTDPFLHLSDSRTHREQPRRT